MLAASNHAIMSYASKHFPPTTIIWKPKKNRGFPGSSFDNLVVSPAKINTPCLSTTERNWQSLSFAHRWNATRPCPNPFWQSLGLCLRVLRAFIIAPHKHLSPTARDIVSPWTTIVFNIGTRIFRTPSGYQPGLRSPLHPLAYPLFYARGHLFTWEYPT